MSIIDLHCDTLMECYLSQWKLRENTGHIDLQKMKKVQEAMGKNTLVAQCFAIFIPTQESAEYHKVTEDAYSYFRNVHQCYQKEMEANQDLIAPALTVADLEKNAAAGKLSSILTVEDGVAIDGKMERVDELFEKGVRMLALTWNYENSLAYPNHQDGEKHQLGLKPFGIDALARMNELGIIVDVSHLSEGGFYDVVKYGKKPFVASHSCARALCDHRRNLTDAQLKALGDCGGMVGVNYYSNFLEKDCEKTTLAQIVKHAKYMADKAGIEAVGFGSDFDGIDCELEPKLKDYTGYINLMDALGKVFTDDEIEQMTHKNFLRVMRDCIGK